MAPVSLLVCETCGHYVCQNGRSAEPAGRADFHALWLRPADELRALAEKAGWTASTGAQGRLEWRCSECAGGR